MRFSLKGNWIQIYMVFLFLKAQYLLFQNSSDRDVTPSITFYYFYWEHEILIFFSKNTYHVKASNWIAFQINWLISIWYNFLLKGVSEQTLITVTLINCKIILVLYNLNSTNQGYEGFNIMEYKYISSKFTLQQEY